MCRGRSPGSGFRGRHERPAWPARRTRGASDHDRGRAVGGVGAQAGPASGRSVHPADGSSRRLPADARAECGRRGAHDAPDPRCTCGFHALSSQRLPGLPIGNVFAQLTVAVVRTGARPSSGPAKECCGGRSGRPWSASSGRPLRPERSSTGPVPGHPGDPDGRLAVVSPATPRDSGPIRLNLPVSSPALPVGHDDAAGVRVQHVRDRRATWVLAQRERPGLPGVMTSVRPKLVIPSVTSGRQHCST